MSKYFILIGALLISSSSLASELGDKEQKETKLFNLKNRMFDPETGPEDRVALEKQFIRQGQLYQKNPMNYFNEVLFNKMLFQDASRTLYDYKDDYYYRFQISNYFFEKPDQFEKLDSWALDDLPHSYLHKRLNRKSKFLNKLWDTFGESLLGLLKPHFKKGSNNYVYVDALLRTYEGIIVQEDYEKKIDEVIIRLDENEPAPASMIEYMKPILVPEIEAEFERTNGSNYYKWQDVQWFHSFWVRRFKEGNEALALEVLTEIRGD